MSFIIPFIPQIIGAGAALFGALKQNSKSGRSTTAEQQQQTTRQGTSSFDRSGTTEGILTPRQHHVEKAALNALLGLIQQGPVVSQADKNLAFTDINKTFNSVIPRLQANFTSRGMGSSGALNKAFETNEYQRANQRGTTMGNLMHDANANWLNAIMGSQRFLTPRTVNTTEQGTQDFSEQGTLAGTSSQTGPDQTGNIIGSTGFALSELLKKIFAGGGLPGGGDLAGAAGGLG